MKRFTFAALAVLLFLLPTWVFARQSESLWDLTQTATADDLQIQFDYPKDWVSDTSSGFKFAENAADLAAITDDDDKTLPKGITLSLQAIPFSKAGLDAPHPTVDQAVAVIVQATGLKVDTQDETSIMTYRAIILTGTSADGRYGAAIVWLQNGTVVLLGMGTADAETTNKYAYSFGQLAATVRPLNALELDDPVAVDGFDGYTIAYPKGWTVQSQSPKVDVFEFEADVQAVADKKPTKGTVISYIHAPLSALKLGTDATYDDLLKSVIGSADPNKPYETYEHILFDKPAFSISQSDVGDSWTTIVGGVVDTEAYLFFVTSPSSDAWTTFQPTLTAMLVSIQKTKT